MASNGLISVESRFGAVAAMAAGMQKVVAAAAGVDQS
ncbi:hypothetical protein MJ8_35480 [Mesorhizobium sp. J8]|nr:hypothetical protein MJ8_35480 [Mesorhizobium sp. J8]